MEGQPIQMDNHAAWDDSALVDSWNEALNEYKIYHSIHARGGSVRDLQREDPSSAKRTAPTRGQDGQADDQPGAPGEARVAASVLGEPPDATTGNNDPPRDGGAAQVSAAFPPQAILGSVRDDNLKRLLMAWYYAGYYMGLHEGYQQAQQPQS